LNKPNKKAAFETAFLGLEYWKIEVVLLNLAQSYSA